MFAAWLSSVSSIDAASRAVDTWSHIQRRPSAIAFSVPKVVRKDGTVTPATALDAQTVRVESDSRASDVAGEAGAAPMRQAIVYGVKGHPSEEVADTIMDEGYTFTLDGDSYRCIDIIIVPGGVQGIFLVNG